MHSDIYGALPGVTHNQNLGVKMLQKYHKEKKKEENRKTVEDCLRANVCFTQAEPLGRCWQDPQQMTAVGW